MPGVCHIFILLKLCYSRQQLGCATTCLLPLLHTTYILSAVLCHLPAYHRLCLLPLTILYYHPHTIIRCGTVFLYASWLVRRHWVGMIIIVVQWAVWERVGGGVLLQIYHCTTSPASIMASSLLSWPPSSL